MYILVQAGLVALAYGAAMRSENPLVRVLGIGFLIARGVLFLIAGLFGGLKAVFIIVGIGLLVLAAHAWSR